jgi:hypothetical protein
VQPAVAVHGIPVALDAADATTNGSSPRPSDSGTSAAESSAAEPSETDPSSTDQSPTEDAPTG